MDARLQAARSPALSRAEAAMLPALTNRKGEESAAGGPAVDNVRRGSKAVRALLQYAISTPARRQRR